MLDFFSFWQLLNAICVNSKAKNFRRVADYAHWYKPEISCTKIFLKEQSIMIKNPNKSWMIISKERFTDKLDIGGVSGLVLLSLTDKQYELLKFNEMPGHFVSIGNYVNYDSKFFQIIEAFNPTLEEEIVFNLHLLKRKSKC